MKIDGSCHCGKVTYIAEIDPGKVVICHCSDCQVLSGSPWRASVGAPVATFQLTGDPPRRYVKTAESGRRRVQAFCPECGTPIYSAAESDITSYGLRLGAIRQRAQLAPARQIWCKSALAWARDLSSVPSSAEGIAQLRRELSGVASATGGGGGSAEFSKMRRSTPGATAATGLMETCAFENVPRTE